MASYLWKKLSDKEKQQIKQEAKKLILEFGDTIENLPDIPESVVEREKDVRGEGEEESCGSEEFRNLMFENAPRKKGDFIQGEKGGWVK